MTISEDLLKELDKVQCGDCPLKRGCNLNLAIYDKALCDELRCK